MAWSHGRGWIYFLFALSAFLFDSFCLTTAGMAELLPFFFPLYTQCLDIQHCVYLHTPRGMDYGIWADYEL